MPLYQIIKDGVILSTRRTKRPFRYGLIYTLRDDTGVVVRQTFEYYGSDYCAKREARQGISNGYEVERVDLVAI